MKNDPDKYVDLQFKDDMLACLQWTGQEELTGYTGNAAFRYILDANYGDAIAGPKARKLLNVFAVWLAAGKPKS